MQSDCADEVLEVATLSELNSRISLQDVIVQPPSLIDELTVLVLTYNEVPNIGRTLDKLRWAPHVLVLDSFSTDDTVAIAKQFPNVEVRQRRFDSFARQCNFGLDQIRTEWVLSLDADYVLSDALIAEIARLNPSGEVCGYTAHFQYCIFGRPLNASLYPARTVLYRRHSARYQDDGHGHRVVVGGPTQLLNGWIDHDDRKSLDRWMGEQVRYSAAEAKKLLTALPDTWNFADHLRSWILPAPFIVFFYTLFVKGLILDGWRGWYYVMQRTLAEILLSVRLIESKLVPTHKP